MVLYMLKKTRFFRLYVLVMLALMQSPGLIWSEESPEASEEPKSLYEPLEWNVDEYFGDLNGGRMVCRAIEENNVDKCFHLDDDLSPSLSPEFQRLILSAVNTKGVDNMTPLMWSLASNNFEAFEHLLKLGANPNVAYIGLPSRMAKAVKNYEEKYCREETKYGELHPMLYAIIYHCRRNCTVVEILADHPDSRWLKAALENGWDPNFRPGAALTIAANSGYMDNFWLLVEAGADINQCRSSFEGVFGEAPEELIPVLEKVNEYVRRRILDLVTMPIEELWKDGTFADNLSSQHWRKGRQQLLDALVAQGIDTVKHWEEYQEWKKTSNLESACERYGWKKMSKQEEQEAFWSILEKPIKIPLEVPRLPNRTLTGKLGTP
ncbi:MAG: ankyrin repeat domain-containing protein [Thermoguttaceae bacterium]|nr:ankyrin repeat domain-containing protein [Thermoguttaceae bacterium]